MAYGGQDSFGCTISSDQVYVGILAKLFDVCGGANTTIDLGLQVLDNVIMTRWKVLPREQCQGRIIRTGCYVSSLTTYRNPELHCPVHHPVLQHRRVVTNAKDIAKQAQSRPYLGPQARMATQLAHVHQRDHFVLPLEPIDLREQHDYPAPAVRRGIRLLCRSDDFGKDTEPQADHVRRVFPDFPAMSRGSEHCHPAKPGQGDP